MSQSSPSGGAKKLGLPVEEVDFEGSFVPERKYQVATILRITRSSSNTNERSLSYLSLFLPLALPSSSSLSSRDTPTQDRRLLPYRISAHPACRTSRHLEGTSCSYERSQRQKAERSLSRVTKGVLTKRYIRIRRRDVHILPVTRERVMLKLVCLPTFNPSLRFTR